MSARRVLRRTAGALLLLAAAPALLLTTLLLEPQWILTSKTVGWAIREFGSDYRPGWTAFDFSIRSPGLLKKEISVAAAGFCFTKSDGSLSGCFKFLETRFTVEISRSGLRLADLAILRAEGESLRSDRTKSSPPASAKAAPGPSGTPRLSAAALSGLKIEDVRVDLPMVELVDSSGTTKGAFRLGYDPTRAAPLTLDARWASRVRGAVHRGRARVFVASDFFKSGLLTSADAKGSIDADGVSAVVSVKARRAGAEGVSLDARASGRAAGAAFRFRASGVQTPTRYALKGGFGVEPSTGALASLRLEPFEFTADRAAGAAMPERLRLTGELRAEPVRDAIRPVRGFTPPRFFTGRLTLDARASPKPRQPDHFDASVSLLVNPYMSWYEAHVDLFARASGRLSELARVRIEQRFDAYAIVPRFEDLVAFLAGGPFAVPAPIAAMKGGVRLSFSARGAPGNDRAEFDYQAKGALGGERQKLKFHLSGGGAAAGLRTKARSIKTRAELTFDEVALQLPHLNALRMPNMKLDSRIKGPGDAAPEAAPPASAPAPDVAGSTTAVALEFSVATARPILLYTDLAKTPVPVALAVTLKNPPSLVSGSVEVKTFGVEFFRRNATVDHVTLTLIPGAKAAGLDGLIKYKATEAMISIRLLGTTDKPKVVLESDPPLSQHDIIAMLVFGKSPNDLDADQSASVANTQTAMSDQAFGLASLYLFASTPIQFVGYDPAAKAYTMKLRIPGGETLQFSSASDATKSVQLRKRLTPHLSIVTEAVSSQTRGNGVVTFLEWFTRY